MENIVPNHDLNNEIIHPNVNNTLKSALNMTNEEIYDELDNFRVDNEYELPSSFMDNLRNYYLIDLNTYYLWRQEYIYFLALSAIFSFKIMPSSKVEKIWRLHMTYTKHYRAMISKIQAFQQNEMTKVPFYNVDDHYEVYSSSLSCYKLLYSESPNETIWESISSRFDKTPW